MSANHAKYLQALGIQTWQERTPKAKVMFVTDIAEFNEDQASSADTLFTAMLSAIQFKREDVHIINLSKDQFHLLDQQISQLKPRMIMAMGNHSAHHLLQTQQPLDSLRSKLHAYGEIPLIITYPPAHLLRNPADKRKSYQDLLFLKQHLDLS